KLYSGRRPNICIADIIVDSLKVIHRNLRLVMNNIVVSLTLCRGTSRRNCFVGGLVTTQLFCRGTSRRNFFVGACRDATVLSGLVTTQLFCRCTSRRNCFVGARRRSEEHTSELQSRENLVCRLPLEKKTA